MTINYDYYRIFYVVAQCRSFTRAAELLKNNQPNITRCMKNLEQELGCKLFHRSNKGITLTPERQRFYRRRAGAGGAAGAARGHRRQPLLPRHPLGPLLPHLQLQAVGARKSARKAPPALL